MELFVRRSTTWEEVAFRDPLDSGYGRSEAGVRVTPRTALTDDALAACVFLLAGDIASLPLKAFQTDGELTQPLPRQPSWIESPDPIDLAITDVVHKMQVALSILLYSNVYVLCEPSVFDPVSLSVMDPGCVRPIKPGRERLFEIMGRDQTDGAWTGRDVLDTLSSAQVLHVPYMPMPGRLEGTSLVGIQAGNLGISIAMRKWVETFFGKGGQVSGLVSLPVGATANDVDEVQKRIQSRWSSWRKAGVLGVLSGGATFIKTGLAPQDADLGSLWRRQLEMAARVYGIPPFMVGSQEPAGVAYASSVERAQHYIDHCINRYTRPIEKAYSRLVPGDGRLAVPHSNTEVRFVFDAFLRGDPAARWGTHLTALQAKARTIGEVRALENLPPMSAYSAEYLAGPDGIYETPQNVSPKDERASLIEEVRAGLRTENEAREVIGLPPMVWSEELSQEESATLIEQVKAGIRTENEVRGLLKLPPLDYADGPSPDDVASLMEQFKAGVITHDEIRADLKRAPMIWPEGDIGPEEVASIIEQLKAGLLTETEARALLKRPPADWGDDPSPEEVASLIEQIKAGLRTHDEVRALLKLPPIVWPDEPGTDEVASMLDLVKAGVLTENELRERMKMPPLEYTDGPSPDDISSLVSQVKEGLLTIDEARASLGRPVVQWPEDLSEKVRQAKDLIAAGFEPADVLTRLGLPPMRHLGLPPTSIQKPADAAGVQPVPTNGDSIAPSARSLRDLYAPPATETFEEVARRAQRGSAIRERLERLKETAA